jgi:hypothetical protein
MILVLVILIVILFNGMNLPADLAPGIGRVRGSRQGDRTFITFS